MKKKDLFLILGLLLVAIAVLAVGLSSRSAVQQTQETPLSSVDADRYSDGVQKSATTYFAENQADAYLLIRSAQSASVPIPLNEEYSFSVRQPDGSENTIHIGVNSFFMESSNCENQNCVEQGTVTLENMNERVLFNMILCLPHELSLEMLTPDQAQAVLLEMLEQQELMQGISDDVTGKENE